MALAFVAKVSRAGDRFLIYVPEEVARKYQDLLSRWNESGAELIVEIKEMAGAVRPRKKKGVGS